MAILDPPTGVIKYIQKHLVGFFWSGQHWPRALVLYLPVHEGGQGLTAIGLLLLGCRLLRGPCMKEDMGCGLLRRGGQLGLDRCLFLMVLNGVDLTGLTPFYKTVLKVWRVGTFSPSTRT